MTHVLSPSAPAFSRSALAGLALAGGRSVRFGGEKAAALLDGRPLLTWTTGRLAATCGAVAVSARPGSEAEALAKAAFLPVLHDAPGDPEGPLSGVKAGLAWAAGIGAEALAVSPCDVPFLPADLFERLAAGRGAALAAVVVTREGREPLCAVWSIAALPSLSRALDRGAHPPTWALLAELGAVEIPFGDAEDFANVNLPEDLKAAEARLR
jgi:molybdopterin-guanine dinucleotide biosynthesis protein A